MTKEKYIQIVRRMRSKIERGGQKNLNEAECGLRELEDFRPCRLEYILAKTALMIAKGEDKEICRNILDGADTECYIHKELSDLFSVKKRTFAEGSLGERMCEFTASLYAGQDVDSIYGVPLRQLKEKVLEQDVAVNTDSLRNLAEAYYIVRDMTMYVVLMMVWGRGTGKLTDYEEYIQESAGNVSPSYNIDYLCRQFTDGTEHTFVLVDSLNRENLDLDVLALGLRLLGQKTILLRGMCALDHPLHDAQESISLSMESASVQSDNIVIRPLRYQLAAGADAEDNIDLLITFIAGSIEQAGALIVFADDERMNELHTRKRSAKQFQRMSEVQPEQFSQSMAFAWAGDYTKYMSYIYGFDVRKRIETPASCEISVVLPVRNNAETLRYTLQTCMEQRFRGDYEIVLSDNSDEGNTAIYDLYQELDDPHIRYYRTPFVLPLTKSFEYAFLQARGEFIFSIGADDGLFPWTMEEIHKIIPQMGDCDIIGWLRGFYAWPGFNGGQQNELGIKLQDKKTGVDVQHIQGLESLKEVILQTDKLMFVMPLLYINSGFRRKYFKKLLEKTGRLWYAASQDVQMGAVNLAINDTYIFTSYPLSIAGMSGGSIGHDSQRVNTDLKKLGEYALKVYDRNNLHICDYVRRWSEYLFPYIELDKRLLYDGVLYLSELGCLSDSYLNEIAWHNIYDDILQCINREDVRFECLIRLIYSAALKSDDKCLADKVEKFYIHALAPFKLEHQDYQQERCYQVGIDVENKWMEVDASDFGITNIHEAVQFLTKLTGL